VAVRFQAVEDSREGDTVSSCEEVVPWCNGGAIFHHFSRDHLNRKPWFAPAKAQFKGM
jgi:hypothetical protein